MNLLCDLVSLKQKSRCLSTAHGHCRHHFVETGKPVSTLMHICGSARLWDYFHIISILDSMPSFEGCPIRFQGTGSDCFPTLVWTTCKCLSWESSQCPSSKNFRGYSSLPCRLMKVRMPVMVARFSIHGSSLSRLLESSLSCSAPLLFPCHDHGFSTNFKNRQLLLSQDLLDACLCAGRS